MNVRYLDLKGAKVPEFIKELQGSEQGNIIRMKKYKIIYGDPAWKYNDKQNTPKLGGAVKHYQTMTIKELCNLPVKCLTEDNAVLFIWTTSPLLEETFAVIKAWGFNYKSSFVWDKIKHNMGHYNSVRHEFLLICTKGSCTPEIKKLFDSVVSIERAEHSKKPKYFADLIDTIYPSGNRIELFARDVKQGWDVWGNEAEGSINLEQYRSHYASTAYNNNTSE